MSCDDFFQPEKILQQVQNPPSCQRVEDLGPALEEWLSKKRQHEMFTDRNARPCQGPDDSLVAMFLLMSKTRADPEQKPTRKDDPMDVDALSKGKSKGKGKKGKPEPHEQRQMLELWQVWPPAEGWWKATDWQSSGQWTSAWNAEELAGGFEINAIERCLSKSPRRRTGQRVRRWRRPQREEGARDQKATHSSSATVEMKAQTKKRETMISPTPTEQRVSIEDLDLRQTGMS